MNLERKEHQEEEAIAGSCYYEGGRTREIGRVINGVPVCCNVAAKATIAFLDAGVVYFVTCDYMVSSFRAVLEVM